MITRSDHALSEARKQFDWRKIVLAAMPGDASAEQRARRDLLARLTDDVEAWAIQFGLPTRRVVSSAYTGAVVTPLDAPYAFALGMAQYTLWLFVFDGYADTLPYQQILPATPESKIAYLDKRLAKLTWPLYAPGGLSDEQGQAYGLWPRATQPPQTERDNNEHTHLGTQLGDALLDLYHGLERTWNEQGHNATSFCLDVFVHETAAVLGVMRGESYQSFVYQATGKQPDLDHYLERSKVSICLRAAGAVAVGFEPDPPAVWSAWATAMEPSMRALRIANDLANIDKEREEGKVNSATIMLEQLGYPPMAAYRANGPQLREVATFLRARRDAELTTFAHQIADFADGPLGYYVRNCSAFTLAMYEEGDYVEPASL